jgi:D-serine deaminase-like pyridoxal phosphate-dependent protein
VLVDVDTGMGRCGVRSADEACAAAEHVRSTPGLVFRGVSGYEGHCMLEPDADQRVRAAAAAMDRLLEAVDAIAAAGIECEIVSAGGTGTYHLTGANPRITEIQAGSYCVMDAFHSALVPDFDVALTVLATVISRHGDQIVVDAGHKAVGTMPPRLAGAHAELLFVNEEHTGLRVGADSPLRVGDRVHLHTGYAPAAANLYDAYHVVEDGVVTDLWPVEARYGTATLG